MLGETLLVSTLVATVGGWLVLRFARAPHAAARAHEAGAHAWTFTTSYFAGPLAILARSRHARVDVYAEAVVVTPLSPRVVVRRADIQEAGENPD